MKDKLTDFVLQVAEQLLKRYGRVDKIDKEEIGESDDYSFDHWIIFTNFKSRGLEILFRIHFSTSAAKFLAKKGLDLEEKQITSIVCHEFMKEFANLVGGDIENRLLVAGMEPNDFDIRVELPKEVPSYIDVDFQAELKAKKIDRCVRFKFGGFEIIVVTRIEIKDQSKLKVIENVDLTNLPDSDNETIEFL